MSKFISRKRNTEEESEAETASSIQIISEEISVVAGQDLNFPNVKFKKDVPVNYTRAAFTALCDTIPNLNHFVKEGVIKIV